MPVLGPAGRVESPCSPAIITVHPCELGMMGMAARVVKMEKGCDRIWGDIVEEILTSFSQLPGPLPDFFFLYASKRFNTPKVPLCTLHGCLTFTPKTKSLLLPL